MSSEMSEEQNTEGVNIPSSEPTQETFDLDAWLDEKSTIPIIDVTVYPDADGGRMLQKASDELTEVEQRIADLETQPNPVLGVGEENPLLNDKVAAQNEKARLQQEISALRQRVLSSALYIEFQINNLDSVLGIQRAVSEALSDEERALMSDVQLGNHFGMHMMVGAIIRITNSEGKVINGPFTFEQIQRLQNRLIMPEKTKLSMAMNEAMNLSNSWTSQLDAGFPGGSADVAG